MRLVLMVMAVIGASIGTGCETHTSHGTPPSLLFVHTAESGELQPASTPGVYQLQLKEPADRVVYFTDRPHRRSGTMDLDAFTAEWTRRGNGFEDDPPNAALSLNGEDVLVFELTDPVRQGNTLHYTARLLHESDRFRTSSTAVVPTGPIDTPALFIDNIYLKDNPSSYTADPSNVSDPAYGNPQAYQGPVHVTPLRWDQP